MSNKPKALLFGGGARRVVVENKEERDDEFIAAIPASNFAPEESRGDEVSTSPFHVDRGGGFDWLGERKGSERGSDAADAETVTGSGRCASIGRLVVPKTVERQGRLAWQGSQTWMGNEVGQNSKSGALQHRGLSGRRASISQEYLPEANHGLLVAQGTPLMSPVPFDPRVSSRLSVSLAAAREQTHPTATTSSCGGARAGDGIQRDDPFLLAWLNSILDPWGHTADLEPPSRRPPGNMTESVVTIHAHKDVLKDRMARQWSSMGGAGNASFADPLVKISHRLARNPLKVAKAMESVVRTAVVKHQVMAALGAYSRVWFEVASDLLQSSESPVCLSLSAHEKEWLCGLVGRASGKNSRLQAFSKLSPEGYCRVTLHVLAVVLLLDGMFRSTLWVIPVWAPPLFCVRTHASSTDVLQGSVGFFIDETDVSRWLHRSGYQVSYVQPTKLCASFCVKNMAVDLRDGVALCRLAELLVPGCEPLKPLYPATRTSERIRNIELALVKLGMNEYVQASLVADGDQSATTGLLWNCMLRFELESALNLNAITGELRRIGGGIVVGHPEIEIHDAYLRCLLSLGSVASGSPPMSAASYVLQWACCLYNTANSSVIIDQNASDHPLGGPLGRRRVLESFLTQYGCGMTMGGGLTRHPTPGSFMKRVDYLLKPLGKDHGMPRIFTEEELLHSNEPLDQRRLLVLYGILLKRVLSVYHEQHAAIIIQRCWRQYVYNQQAPEYARKHLQMWINAATVIQRNVRPFLARRRIEASRASRVLFVQRITRLQSLWRQKMHSERYQAVRSAAIVIQAQWRGFAARSEARARAEQAEVEMKAAVTIQAYWRSFVHQNMFKASRNACLTIQTTWRMANLRRQFTWQRDAAVVIQKHVRRLLVEQELRTRENACLRIQTVWRMSHHRHKFLEMRSSAVTIQSTWRMVMDRTMATARLEAALIIQKQWRAVRQRQLDNVTGSLQLATLELVDALMDFANATRADLRVDKMEKRRLEAAKAIQAAWREHVMVRKFSRYLLDLHDRASVAVQQRATKAKEEWAARAIQSAWRERVVLQRTSQYLMRVFENAKETVRLNELYGASVITIQAQVRGYLVRTLHPSSKVMKAIRDQLRAATERAEVLRREGIEDPTTLGNMTSAALQGLHCGVELPSARTLQHLDRCLGGSISCCQQFIDGCGVQYLIGALIKTSRDRMREDSVEQALMCIQTLAACGRFSDLVGSALLEKNGEDLKRLFRLLYQHKDSHEVFHAIISALRAVGQGTGFCQTVASSDELSGTLFDVHRAISVKQSQVALYLDSLQSRRGSEVSIANATRTLFRMEKQTKGLAGLMEVLGVDVDRRESDSAGIPCTVPASTPARTTITALITPKAKTGTRMTVKKGLGASESKNTKSGIANPTPRRVLGNISNLVCN